MSDGTGKTAELALQAALTQFPDVEVQITRFPGVRKEQQIYDITEGAAENGSTIVHTVVSTQFRNLILEPGRLHNVETIDLMGHLLARLSNQFDYSPSEKPGLFRKLNRAYFQRIEAMEFTLRHDDGQRVRELEKAEIILLGVSRTFKTPLSIFLAFKGWMVANVPIVLDIEPPSILEKLPPRRVFCLTTDPRALAALRSVRHEHLGGATGEYASLDYVRRELKYAYQYFLKQQDWSIIKVTHKPIEEIATEILKLMRVNKVFKKEDELDDV